MEYLSETAERLIDLITTATKEEQSGTCDVDTISFRIKKLAEVLKQETDCTKEKSLAEECLRWYDDHQRASKLGE